VRINQDAWVYLFDINPKGEVVLLYPVDENGELASDQKCGSRLFAGKALVLPEDGCSYDLVVDEPYGKDAVWVVASEFPLYLSDFSNDDWFSADLFQENLRKQGFAKSGGYAEAMVEIITMP
jgi:hypothetical protein